MILEDGKLEIKMSRYPLPGQTLKYVIIFERIDNNQIDFLNEESGVFTQDSNAATIYNTREEALRVLEAVQKRPQFNTATILPLQITINRPIGVGSPQKDPVPHRDTVPVHKTQIPK